MVNNQVIYPDSKKSQAFPHPAERIEQSRHANILYDNFNTGVVLSTLAKVGTNIHKTSVKKLINMLVMPDGTLASRPGTQYFGYGGEVLSQSTQDIKQKIQNQLFNYKLYKRQDRNQECRFIRTALTEEETRILEQKIEKLKEEIRDEDLDKESEALKSQNTNFFRQEKRYNIEKLKKNIDAYISIIPYIIQENITNFILLKRLTNRYTSLIIMNYNGQISNEMTILFNSDDLDNIFYTQIEKELIFGTKNGDKLIKINYIFRDDIYNYDISYLLFNDDIELPITSLLPFQKRLWVAGSRKNPLTIYGSKIGEYSTFISKDQTGFSDVTLQFFQTRIGEYDSWISKYEMALETYEQELIYRAEHKDKDKDKTIPEYDFSILETEVNKGKKAMPNGETLYIQRVRLKNEYEYKFNSSKETNAVCYTCLVEKIARIEWMFIWQNSIVLGTNEKLLIMTGRAQQPQLTGNNIVIRVLLPFGSNNIKPIEINKNTFIFISNDNRKIYEVSGTVVAPIIQDISITCPYFLGDEIIKKVEVQYAPFTIIWVLSQYNNLYSFSYNKQLELFGWSQHKISNNDSYNNECMILDITMGYYNKQRILFLVIQRGQHYIIERLDDITKIYNNIFEDYYDNNYSKSLLFDCSYSYRYNLYYNHKRHTIFNNLNINFIQEMNRYFKNLYFSGINDSNNKNLFEEPLEDLIKRLDCDKISEKNENNLDDKNNDFHVGLHYKQEINFYPLSLLNETLINIPIKLHKIIINFYNTQNYEFVLTVKSDENTKAYHIIKDNFIDENQKIEISTPEFIRNANISLALNFNNQKICFIIQSIEYIFTILPREV